MKKAEKMIRIKILYDYGYDNWRNCKFYDNKYSFMDLVNTYNLFSEDEPFRDDESRMFIEQIDHAEFSSKYGVVTPYGECPLTSLSGGTRYALTVIHNSRMGKYTSFEPYGEDIWGRLENLPFDVLIFVEYDEIQFSHMSAIEKCLIENYRDEKGNISEKLIDNLSECVDIFFKLSFSFNLTLSFESVILCYAKSNIKNWHMLNYPPFICNSFKELGDFIGDEYETERFQDCEYPDVKICSYLTDMISIMTRKPIVIMIERCQETKTYTVKETYSVKNPTFSELIMETGYYVNNNKYNALDNFGNWDKMILTFDDCEIDCSKKWLNNICLCEKLEGKTISLYNNGKRIWYELLKFIDGYTINFKEEADRNV